MFHDIGRDRGSGRDRDPTNAHDEEDP